jgi:hypothetical protein
MRWFGRSKKQKNEELFEVVTDIAYDCLISQKLFIGDNDFHIRDAQGDINGKALGYVFGFLDSLLQSKGLDIRDEEGYARMLSLLARLFPAELNHIGTYIIYLSNMKNDAEVLNGVMLGGKQAVDFLRDKTPPLRWAMCFSKELARLAEERDRQRSQGQNASDP